MKAIIQEIGLVLCGSLHAVDDENIDRLF